MKLYYLAYNVNSFSSSIVSYAILVRLDEQFFRAFSKYFQAKMTQPPPPFPRRKIGPCTNDFGTCDYCIHVNYTSVRWGISRGFLTPVNWH